MFCLQNGANFGKSQLMNGNFGKSKQKQKWRENSNFFKCCVEKRDFLSDY